jgi:hypothetical protein
VHLVTGRWRGYNKMEVLHNVTAVTELPNEDGQSGRFGLLILHQISEVATYPKCRHRSVWAQLKSGGDLEAMAQKIESLQLSIPSTYRNNLAT